MKIGPSFYDHRFKLIFESDTHTMKRTSRARTSEKAQTKALLPIPAARFISARAAGVLRCVLPTMPENGHWPWANSMASTGAYLSRSDRCIYGSNRPRERGGCACGRGCVQPTAGGRSLAGRRRDAFGRQPGGSEKLTTQFQLDHFAANQPPAGCTAWEDYDMMVLLITPSLPSPRTRPYRPRLRDASGHAY